MPSDVAGVVPIFRVDKERAAESLIGLFDVPNVEHLSTPMRNLLNALLLYKSMFAGPWFAALSLEEDPQMQAAYEGIRSETAHQARRAAEILSRWDAAAGGEATEKVTDQVLKRLLADMLELKQSSTEVFLGAGLSSPTDEMRREFLELADVDRRHAEVLRKALGGHSPLSPTDEPHAPVERTRARGVFQGPFARGTISREIRAALDEARAEGHEPSRLVLSQACLRHLRDEGSVAPKQGDIFGIPADIDFSWGDEAFAITSRERLSLAEIVTEMAIRETAEATSASRAKGADAAKGS